MLLMCEIGKGVLTENLVFDKLLYLPERNIVVTTHVVQCYELTHGEVMLRAETAPSASRCLVYSRVIFTNSPNFLTLLKEE
jgi:hypothetical protein